MSRPRSHHPGTTASIVVTLLALLLAGAAAAGTVTIEGRIVDAEGAPLDGSTVVLELRRESFSLRTFSTRIGEPLRMTTVADAEGRFRFILQPESHYNRFALGVGVELRKDGTPALELLADRDLTEEVNARKASGGLIEVELEVADAGFLRWLERWRDQQASEDEDRLFRDLGRPDRLTIDPDGGAAWWYFAAGKVYRLRDGALEQVQHFEPVPDAP